MVSVLLATPPLLEPDSPYPATTYLTGFLRSRGITAHQADLSIMLTTRLLSRACLPLLREAARDHAAGREDVHPNVAFFLAAYDDYYRAVDPVMAFLRGQDPTLARRINSRAFCPENPNFTTQNEPDLLQHAFGTLALQERAKFLATCFISDLISVITATIDPDFVPWQYGEALPFAGPGFQPLADKLARAPSLIDRELLGLWTPLLERHRPDLICLTVPFAGNLYGALRLGKATRATLPAAKIVLGGAFAAGYLRTLDEPAVFDFVDYIVLDAGERPLERLIAHLEGRLPAADLHRTWMREQDRVIYRFQADLPDIPQARIGAPTYADLPLDHYFSTKACVNPVSYTEAHTRWNKLTLAYGCYWKRCAFCDTQLDINHRYDPTPAEQVADRMEQLAAETGWTGFYFVDQVSPPKQLKALSRVLIERGLSYSWFTNIRFEHAFEDPELTDLMARAGCIHVMGGLEATSNRLLELIDKQTTIEQIARACRALSRAGISVHAYMIYGLPTETEQETVENLEHIRQLLALGYLHTVGWSRFRVTSHSPIARDPERYGIRLLTPDDCFARNEIPHQDPTPYDHQLMGAGVQCANDYFMRGLGLDRDVRSWFTKPFEPPKAPPDFIRSIAPPATEKGRTTRRQAWRPAGSDRTARPRHGFRVPDLIMTRQDGEDILLLDLRNSASYRFENIGAECWRLLAAGLPVAEITAAIADTYSAPPEQVSADISGFIDDLCENGLLQRDYGPVDRPN